MKRGFGSDNHSGICPEVLKAIADANVEHALAYGDDEYCARVEQLFKKHFGEQAVVSSCLTHWRQHHGYRRYGAFA